MWDRQRIDEEHGLKEKYGLKNLREVWMAQSELRRIRRNVREVLSGKASEEVGRNIIARLAKYSIVSNKATLDDLLIVDTNAILGRRLQSLVFERGMAKSIKQARQLITHGFIAVDGKRVTSPSYVVPAVDDQKISFYKSIDLEVKPVVAAEGSNAEAAQEEAQEEQAPAEGNAE